MLGQTRQTRKRSRSHIFKVRNRLRSQQSGMLFKRRIGLILSSGIWTSSATRRFVVVREAWKEATGFDCMENPLCFVCPVAGCKFPRRKLGEYNECSAAKTHLKTHVNVSPALTSVVSCMAVYSLCVDARCQVGPRLVERFDLIHRKQKSESLPPLPDAALLSEPVFDERTHLV